MTRRFLRTIRFDGTDDFVFEPAARASEWAISGSFVFADMDETVLVGKTRQAFANGFLSLESFGWSTFVCVSQITATRLSELESVLAQHFVDRYGAPDLQAAVPAACAEIAFVEDLIADVPINTIFAVQRTMQEDGAIREQFRKIEQRISGGPIYAKAWEASHGD
ncbi:MAG: DUF6505 family protein [Hyphomicrobiaceae bacterium]